MSNKRITLFFANDKGLGWSETYYGTANSLAAMLTKSFNLALKRKPLLARGNWISFLRVSEDDPARDSLLQKYDVMSPAGVTDEGDAAHTCAMVRIESGPQFHRHLTLRGIPDDLVLNNGRVANLPAWDNAFTNFADYLVNNNYSIRALDPATPRQNITTMAQAVGDGTITCTTAPAHGLNTLDLAIIRQGRVGGGKAARGRHRVFVLSNTEFKFPSKRILDNYIVGATVAKVTYILTPITSVAVEGISHRITGRPFGLPRGRRPASA